MNFAIEHCWTPRKLTNKKIPKFGPGEWK